MQVRAGSGTFILVNVCKLDERCEMYLLLSVPAAAGQHSGRGVGNAHTTPLRQIAHVPCGIEASHQGRDVI